MATAQMPKTMFVIVSEEEEKEEEEEVEEKDVGAKGTMPVEGEVEELTGDMLIEGYDCGISVIARLSDLEYTEAAQRMCLTHSGNQALLMCLDSPFTEQLERGCGSQHGRIFIRVRLVAFLRPKTLVVLTSRMHAACCNGTSARPGTVLNRRSSVLHIK